MIACAHLFDSSKAKAAAFPSARMMPPAQKLLLEENHVLPSQLRFTVRGDGLKASVVSNVRRETFESDLTSYKQRLISCSCGRPAITGRPCEHNETHALKLALTVAHISDKRLTTAGWKASYADSVAFGEVCCSHHIIPDADELHVSVHTHVGVSKSIVFLRKSL